MCFTAPPHAAFAFVTLWAGVCVRTHSHTHNHPQLTAREQRNGSPSRGPFFARRITWLKLAHRYCRSCAFNFRAMFECILRKCFSRMCHDRRSECCWSVDVGHESRFGIGVHCINGATHVITCSRKSRDVYICIGVLVCGNDFSFAIRTTRRLKACARLRSGRFSLLRCMGFLVKYRVCSTHLCIVVVYGVNSTHSLTANANKAAANIMLIAAHSYC